MSEADTTSDPILKDYPGATITSIELRKRTKRVDDDVIRAAGLEEAIDAYLWVYRLPAVAKASVCQVDFQRGGEKSETDLWVLTWDSTIADVATIPVDIVAQCEKVGGIEGLQKRLAPLWADGSLAMAVVYEFPAATRAPATLLRTRKVSLGDASLRNIGTFFDVEGLKAISAVSLFKHASDAALEVRAVVAATPHGWPDLAALLEQTWQDLQVLMGVKS